jgi:hypothetical protein
MLPDSKTLANFVQQQQAVPQFAPAETHLHSSQIFFEGNKSEFDQRSVFYTQEALAGTSASRSGRLNILHERPTCAVHALSTTTTLYKNRTVMLNNI